MKNEKKVNLKQYLNIAGYDSRDKFVAMKLLQSEGLHSICEWTKIMMKHNIVQKLSSSLEQLLTTEEITSLQK